MWKEFKEFALRGSALELAIGVVIGAAFGQITHSLVNDVIMPPLSLLTGKVDLANLFIPLSSGRSFDTLAQAKAAGVATINYGAFLNSLISFIIVALAVFFVIRQVNRFFRLKVATTKTKTCPYCASKIPLNAVKCPQCTSNLE